jgi:hypothetical protein
MPSKPKKLVFKKDKYTIALPIKIFADADKEPIFFNTVFGVYQFTKVKSRKIIQV